MSLKTPTPEQLEAAAKALRFQEKMKPWRSIDTSGSVTDIDWQTGRSVAGYADLAEKVSQKLGFKIHDLVQECLDDIDRDVEQKLREIGL